MEGIVCKMCGFISIDGSTPGNCPVCGAPSSAFEQKQDAIKVAVDSQNMTEGEKKHTPIIKVMDKECCSEGSTKVAVTVGEITHPMAKEHYIQHIDLYKNKVFLARILLTAEGLNPAGAICLKEAGAKITAVILCNVHGAWISEQQV